MSPACVAVAYSGGRDSSALVHAALAEAAPLGIKVAALHVHHGLSPNADDWLSHCEAQCALWARRGWPVVFASLRVPTAPVSGESVEAWARMQRYRALRSLAVEQGASMVLLAQHRRDQAETFLLQALRGAGPAGLAGMPASVVREGIVWARPWLGRPHEDIKAYVSRHRLKFIEDESNDDPRFARNRLRLRLWPVLTDSFPQAEAALADSAQWAQEALICLSDLAQLDMATLVLASGRLDIRAWSDLSAARRSNALRAWLKLRLGSAAPASLVSRLMRELRYSRVARWPMESGELRLYRGVLSYRMEHKPQSPSCADFETTLAVNRIGKFSLPGWGGCLRVAPIKQGGVNLAWLGQLELKPRQGAEQFQGSLLRPPRSLKKQYQAAGVAAWDREGPLFYSGGQLIFVPGLGIDARVLALPGQPQVSLRWSPVQVAELKSTRDSGR